ncbi:MAG: hypothetical protein HQ567_00650 [Candidatus Nealsonbacteria bacterium]|nr:hypothetical protein [Candidatus Nealsonbacteria bacterium]
MTIERRVHFQCGRSGRRQLQAGKAAPRPTVDSGRIPRVSRLMALAIRFERLVRDGEVADYADLARLGYVTRARVTQIMNLLNLAPDIQEAILFLPPVDSGRDPVIERDLRPIAAIANWRKQRALWSQVVA